MKELKRFLNKKTLALFLVAALACAPVNAITSQAEPYQGGFTDTSEYPNLTYAECVYQNVTVDAGGTASRVTDPAQQKLVVDQVKRLNNATIKVYSGFEHINIAVRSLYENGPDKTYVQKENFVKLETKEEAKAEGYEQYDSVPDGFFPILITYCESKGWDADGEYVKDWNGNKLSKASADSILKSTYNVNTVEYVPGSTYDNDHDGIITFGELYSGYSQYEYDAEKKKAVDKGNPVEFYAFNLNGSNESPVIHIEGDRNINNWTQKTESGADYSYTYYDYDGNTRLYPRVQDDGKVTWYNGNEHTEKGHLLVALSHYNEGNNTWERIPGYYKPDQMGAFTTKLAGDGLYIATVFVATGGNYIYELEQLVDVSEYEKAAGPVAGTTSNSAQTSASALAPFEDGNWYLFTDGKINSAYTGLFYDQNVGWWLVQNGRVAFEYNDLYYDANLGWWKVTNGAVDFEYNGIWYSPIFGWWYVQKGAVSFSYTGLVANDYGWWYVQNGAINFNYTGLVPNDYGWWYVENGAINFNATGLVANEYGWWYVQNGTINFAYNGLVANDYGWWYVENGAINFNYNGLAYDPYVGWWVVNNGAINFGYTGMVANDYGWWYAVNGALDLGATGWACNDYGWWLYYNGTIAFNYTGWWGDYYCVNGHLA